MTPPPTASLGVGSGEPYLPPSLGGPHPCGYHSHATLHRLCRWVSVLQNSKDEALSSAFLAEPSGGGPGPWGGAGLDGEPQDLTKLLIAEVKSRPGNGQCCDCGAAGGPAGRGGRREVAVEGTGPHLQARAALPCRPHVAQHQPGRAHLHPVLRRPPRAGRALLAHAVPHLGPAGPL